MNRRTFFKSMAAGVCGLAVGNGEPGPWGTPSGSGWQITPQGNAEFDNIWARGELHATVFVKDEVRSAGGTFMVATAGLNDRDFVLPELVKLPTPASPSVEVWVGPGRQPKWLIWDQIEIDSPGVEPTLDGPIFMAGEVLRTKFLADDQLYEIWFEIMESNGVDTGINRQKVRLVRLFGGRDGMVVPAEVSLVGYGVPTRTIL